MSFAAQYLAREYPRALPLPFGEVMLRQFGTSVVLGLLLWGWFAWILTPVERHYFGAYALSSVHMKAGADPDTVTWILKTGPQKKRDIAQLEDLVSGPETDGNPPFQLSAKARAEGWTGVDWSVPEVFPAASTPGKDSCWIVTQRPWPLAGRLGDGAASLTRRDFQVTPGPVLD